MPGGRFDGRLSLVTLCVSLVVVTVLFGVRAEYGPVVYYALAAFQIAAVCISAWALGASAITSATDERRRLALSGTLLIAPWMLFSVLAGFATPWQATAPENQLRYLVLFANAAAIGVGLIVLREALSEAGERFYSTLGFAAISLASPLFLVWATILLYESSARVRADPSALPPAAASLLAMSDILLFFGGVLTYLATAAFAASLGRAKWIGRRATAGFVIVSLLAALFLAIRGLQFPDPSAAFRHWYDVPGFVLGIPAIPWIIPVIFGIILLVRAGHRQNQA